MRVRRARARVMPPVLREGEPGYDLERYTVQLAAAYLMQSEQLVRIEVGAKRMGHRRNGARGEILMSQADLDRWRHARRCEPVLTPVDIRRGQGRRQMTASAPSVVVMPKERKFAVR